MISVLVMANDSLLADAIVSMLAEEIDLDVIRLTHRELGSGDHQSVVIVVDEGKPEDESIKVADLFRDRSTLLVIMISLKSRDTYIYESYQLANPRMERVIQIVRESSRMNLKKKVEEDVNMGAFKKVNMTRQIQIWPRTYHPVGHLFGNVQALNFDDRLLTKAGMLSFKEMAALFHSFFLHYLGRKNWRTVTRLNSTGRSTGFNRRG